MFFYHFSLCWASFLLFSYMLYQLVNKTKHLKLVCYFYWHQFVQLFINLSISFLALIVWGWKILPVTFFLTLNFAFWWGDEWNLCTDVCGCTWVYLSVPRLWLLIECLSFVGWMAIFQDFDFRFVEKEIFQLFSGCFVCLVEKGNP